MVYPIKHKNEVFNCFKNYVNGVSSLFNKRVSKLKCDNGGEYSSKEFSNFCSERGIQILYTPPYSPQVNGISERMNQTLVDKSRPMIMQANISKMTQIPSVISVFIYKLCT